MYIKLQRTYKTVSIRLCPHLTGGALLYFRALSNVSDREVTMEARVPCEAETAMIFLVKLNQMILACFMLFNVLLLA